MRIQYNSGYICRIEKTSKAMLVPFHKILNDAYAGHYAVGAFNCLSIEHVIGAIQAAEELRSPIILQLAEVQFPCAPIELMAPVYLEAARKATVPVAVHLDHGQSLETCVKAITLGFNSVMFDGANLPFEENVRQTAAIVRIADVEESAEFIAKTGVDALAIAIGNLHGRYVATPKLNIDRLKEIAARNNMPLVLHGGSGTSEEDFKACIHNGISKINVATALQMAVTADVKAYVEDPMANYIDMKGVITEATKKSVMDHIMLFESNGKA